MAIPTSTLPKHVFCGKDKRLAEEEGSVIFKSLILENVERYNIDNDKSRKMRMTAEILEEFKIRSNGGQFLKEYKDTNQWVQCEDGWVRDKVSHALRFQIKRRPRLVRKLSLPDPTAKKRTRSESFDSCPAKIETVPMHGCSGDWNIAYQEDFLDESDRADPLILFEEMVLAGELDHCYSTFVYSNNMAQRNTKTDHSAGEILTDTEENFELSDSSDDDF